MSKLTKALTAAAGNAGAGALYVEDVFSTYLYIGNSANQNIVNGIDLAGEGGMVWTKRRDNSQLHGLFDTERGVLKYISSDRTDAETTRSNTLRAFNSDGFQLGSQSFPTSNSNGEKGVSWTFRKAEKFFDVVTYTGNGSTTYAHSLNAIPAFVLYKATSTTSSWLACTRKNDGSYVVNILNGTTGTIFSYADADAMGLTETTFNPDPTGASSVGTEYVAYLFASDAGGFGDDGSENIIKCGSVSYNGGATVDLGFEPQWVLVKTSDATGNWVINDNMRGMPNGSRGPRLDADTSNAEFANATVVYPTATGFIMPSGLYDPVNLIYIAIRRPMKTPESGTEVFAINDNVASDSVKTTSGITTDVFWERPSYNSGATGQSFNVSQRLTRTVFQTQSTAAEGGPYGSGYLEFDYMDGFLSGLAGSISPGLFYSFKRATGFFDVVAYTGDGVAGSTQAHNLGVVPEFMVIKQRSGANNWICGGTILGTDGWMFLNSNLAQDTQPAYWNNTLPAATQFTVGSATAVNETSQTYIAYLFATLDGVSKVGSYTGNGTSQTIDCGFSGGARFFLVKASSTTGDWHVFDTARGIVAGNDSYLELNTTNAEDTDEDAVDPVSSGVIVNETSGANINTSGVTYIYLAIS